MSSCSISVCPACAHAFFPPRVLCPRCGRIAPHEQHDAGAGVVEDATQAGDATIVSVRLATGPVVIARSGSACGRETAVRLEDRHGAITAVPIPTT